MVKRKLQKALALLMAISMSVSLMSVMVLAEEPAEETRVHNQIDCTAANCSGGKVIVNCELQRRQGER